MRLLKPHSLSYHEHTLTNVPSATLVRVASKIEDEGLWLKSTDTSCPLLYSRIPFSSFSDASFIALLTSSTVVDRSTLVAEDADDTGPTPPTFSGGFAAYVDGVAQELTYTLVNRGTADSNVGPDNFANFAFEHFEIASYRSLIAMADDCGETEVVRVCRQILQQEETAGRKLEQMVEPTTHTYLQREAADLAASR